MPVAYVGYNGSAAFGAGVAWVNQLLPDAFPGAPAISDPTSLGVSTVAAIASQTITTTQPVPAKALICVTSICSGVTGQITAVSDNGGVNGAYAVLDSAATAWLVQVAWIQNGASVLPAGSTITVTYVGATNSRRCGAFYSTFPAGQTVTADTHAHATSNVASVNASALVSTGVLAQAIELVLLLVHGGIATTGWTPSAGFSTMILTSVNPWLSVGFQKTNATTSIDGTSTWTTASPYGADIISFKGA